MKIWLVTIGEPLPTDEGAPRLLRHGLLAELLADRGHDVLWWTSSFDHSRKLQRVEMSTTLKVRPGLSIRILRAPGYSRNRSLKRFVDHYTLARRFRQEARVAVCPDVILASYPPVELCMEAVYIGQARKVPVVLDMRDAWPDIFLEMVPPWARLPVRVALWPYNRMANRARAQATAILGVTQGYVEWGTEGGGRRSGPLDLDFPLACSDRDPSPADRERARLFWDQAGIREADDAFTVCFFGSLAPYFEMDVVFDVARRLKGMGSKIRFVVCGRGDSFAEYRELAAACGNVVMAGWVGAAEIRELMRRAHVGLAPYRPAWYFRIHIPNKVIEYLSGGLPVVSSLEGAVEHLLQEANCGLTYRTGDAGALVTLLQALEKNPERLAQMASNALCLFKKSFSVNVVYSEMAAHLERIANSQS